jgi:hypothetical protein
MEHTSDSSTIGQSLFQSDSSEETTESLKDFSDEMNESVHIHHAFKPVEICDLSFLKIDSVPKPWLKTLFSKP